MDPTANVSNLDNLNVTIETSSNLSIVRSSSVFESQIIVPLYGVIFALSVVGNLLVLFTLVRNKRMRTVTNVYLLNLAFADLLLGVFCMPFTLIGQVLRNFIFGETMCKLIAYFQTVSVSVAVWTLVAISLERYFAICRPLKSRRWQTRKHASKMILFVWTASLGWSGPILLVSTLQEMKRGHKCRESWPSKSSEQMYNLFLNIILLLIPLFIISLAYSMIVDKLWKGLQREIEHNSCQKLVCHRSSSSPSLNNKSLKGRDLIVYSENGTSGNQRLSAREYANCQIPLVDLGNQTRSDSPYVCMFKQYMQMTDVDRNINTKPSHKSTDLRPKESAIMKETTYTFARHGIRSNYMDRSIEAKRKVIRMLFVIVAEFFICWTPLHILNTWYLYYPKEVYELVGSTGVSLIQLLAYVHSCSNPITYCFMNRKFRQAFFTAFKCRAFCVPNTSTPSNIEGRARNIILEKNPRNSENSCNDSTLFMGRISYSARSDTEAEDRV